MSCTSCSAACSGCKQPTIGRLGRRLREEHCFRRQICRAAHAVYQQALTALASRMVTWRSVTANSPQAAVSFRMESRVTPGKMVPSSGGVASSLRYCTVLSQHVLYRFGGQVDNKAG